MKIGVVVILILLLLSSCGNSGQKSLSDIDKSWISDTLQTEFENVKHHMSEMAKTKVVLSAPLYKRFTTGWEVYPNGFELEYFDPETHEKTTYVRADYGEVFEGKNAVYNIYGNILVKNLKRNQTLETDTLHWDRVNKEIYTNDSVVIKTDSYKLHGIGMRADDEFNKYKIYKPTGVFNN